MKTIVVGVDGSECSLAAEFAAQEAAFREARLSVVAAWDLPPNALLIEGAVPQQVVPHAPCSVVVVRAEPEAPGGGSD